MKNTASYRNNLVFFVFLILIPALALNVSFYFLAQIDENWAKKEQEKRAVQEAETLASEAAFESQFSALFREYFEVIKSDFSINFGKDYFLTSHLEQSAKAVFREPFPNYNLYVFKKTNSNEASELVFHHGTLKGGRRGLSLAFDHIYNICTNVGTGDVKSKSNEAFAKNLLGPYTPITAIAKEMRGLPTFAKSNNKFSWFIWDYDEIPGKGVIGAVLTCDEIEKHDEYGRLLALRNLKSRGRAIGAFIPIFKDFGPPLIQHPLDKSKIFLDWAKSITINYANGLYQWSQNTLPKAVPLGNYTAFCHLGRGSTHAAVVLVKALPTFSFPQWLIFTNFLLALLLALLLILGIGYGIWPSISLSLRFSLAYILASILPLSLLGVTAYGYILQYQHTVINQTNTELESALKSFDTQKSAIVNEYVNAFTQAVNDERLAKLIKEKGVDNELVARRVVDIFENKDSGKYLPVLGVKIFDESGEGAYAGGNASTTYDAKAYIESSSSTYVELLRTKLKFDDPNADNWMKKYEGKADNDFAARAYYALIGETMSGALLKYESVPVARKNNNFYSLQVYDYIKIDGKARYLMLVVWDYKALDGSILENAFNKQALKNIKQNFLGFRIKGQNLEIIGRKTRHATQKVLGQATDLAKLVSSKKRLDTYSDNENIIVAVPSDSFSQTILVGWVSNDDLLNDISNRKWMLFFFILISLIVLGICIVRSVKVFLKPVNALKSALDDVSSENLNIRLESRSADELGRLSDEFSNMIDGLREKERLSKLISDQAVQALKKKNEGLLNDTETFSGVVLVSDIRNFTGMSEEYEPTMITDLLNEHFAEMTKVISDNGGLIYKFIGDAIEAVFPEKEGLELSAKERAFKAGCMMIATLVAINNRRQKNGLFAYKIGVGLCYGTIHSGTVGSMETRLDYAILGEALKQAAKLEALSVQNPPFPLVIDEDIAEKLAALGLGFKKLDTNGEEFSAYTLDEIKNEASKDIKRILDFNGETEVEKAKKDENKSQELKIYSLQSDSLIDETRKTLLFALVMVFSIALFIAVGVNIVYFTGFNSLKSESDSECARLFEQINCNDALKAAFEVLCIDFYGELDKILKNKDSRETLSNLVKPITQKYEALGRPIPKYYCCRLSMNEEIIKPEDAASIGFSSDSCNKIASIALTFRVLNDGYFESSVEPANTRAIHALMGSMTSEFSMRSSHFRRSALVSVEGEELFVNTNRFFHPKNRNDCYGYAFCGMPPKVPKEYLLNYYSVYAGTDYLLAFKSKDKWYFSADFPHGEMEFLKNNFNNEAELKNKGYSKGETKLAEENVSVFAITKKLAAYHQSPALLNFLIILISIIFFGALGYFLSKKIIISGSSLASKLRLYIIVAAILPLITVIFVSYLYISEEYNVKKADKYLELQNHMDGLENKYTYYRPFCWYYINKLLKSNDFHNVVSNVNNAKSEQEQKKAKLALRRMLQNSLVARAKSFFGVDPYFRIKEATVLGKKNWMVSVTDDGNVEEGEDKLNDFSRVLVEASRANFFKDDGNSASANVSAVKGEIVVENLIQAVSSAFGNDAGMRALNHPNNPTMMSAVYTTVGSLMIPLPNTENPEYIMIILVIFSNESMPNTASLINNRVPIGDHIASGSVGEESYVFYAPDILIGQHFYYRIEEFWELVRELSLASAWVNASKLPIFKTVDIQGPKFFACRRGNLIGDCIVAAFSSEKPAREGIFKNISRFAVIIIISIIMIYLIAQSIVSDLIAPIRRLIIGAKSAARSDYGFRADYHSEDELGRLCGSFDKMMKGLEEKQLMNRMVSKTALNVTSNVADSQSKKIESVLMYVTVPGFAEIMKKASPYKLFSELRNQIATLAEIVLKEGGDIDKIMGEKLLIAFHSNEKTGETLAADACRAAYLIGICEKLPFKVAIGINQGRVIYGFLGVGEKRDFTVIGDPVNVAARIASCAEKLNSGHCLISETIYKLVSKDIKAEKQGEVSLKGKSQPMTVYRLL